MVLPCLPTVISAHIAIATACFTRQAVDYLVVVIVLSRLPFRRLPLSLPVALTDRSSVRIGKSICLRASSDSIAVAVPAPHVI